MVGLLVCVALIPFFLFTEVQRVLGKERIAEASF